MGTGRGGARLRQAAAAVMTAGVLAGCSVQVQDHPVPVSDGPLTSSQQPAAQGSTPTLVQSPVFFVHGGRLQAEQRRLAPGDPLVEVIAALVAGPGEDAAAGLRTALPAGVTDLDVRLTDGIATVAVPPDFGQLGARSEILAVGQLVFTAMTQPGVRGVQLTSSGAPIEVPIDTGQLVARAVTRLDYPSIAPL